MRRPILILCTPNIGQTQLAESDGVFDFYYVKNSPEYKDDTYACKVFDEYMFNHYNHDFIFADVSVELCKRLRKFDVPFMVVTPYPTIDSYEKYKSEDETEICDDFIKRIEDVKSFCLTYGYSLIFLNHPDSLFDNKYLWDIIPAIVELTVKGETYK